MATNAGNKICGNSDGRLDFEANLWAAAEELRAHMGTSEYKHLCFLSDRNNLANNANIFTSL